MRTDSVDLNKGKDYDFPYLGKNSLRLSETLSEYP